MKALKYALPFQETFRNLVLVEDVGAAIVFGQYEATVDGNFPRSVFAVPLDPKNAKDCELGWFGVLGGKMRPNKAIKAEWLTEYEAKNVLGLKQGYIHQLLAWLSDQDDFEFEVNTELQKYLPTHPDVFEEQLFQEVE